MLLSNIFHQRKSSKTIILHALSKMGRVNRCKNSQIWLPENMPDDDGEMLAMNSVKLSSLTLILAVFENC